MGGAFRLWLDTPFYMWFLLVAQTASRRSVFKAWWELIVTTALVRNIVGSLNTPPPHISE